MGLLLALAVLAWAGALARPVQAAPELDWQSRTTTYFTIYYTAADAATAAQYAASIDEIYEYVAAVFGHGPTPPVPLRLYPDTDSYTRANPIAAYVEGVVAHADPRRGEIGLALDRLARAGPEVARDTVRHELMHLVATELSADRLPIGFQEGLAQYVEKETGERQQLVWSLQLAYQQGRLLSWDALNDYPRFLRRLSTSYPQALSMVAFLVDRYGLGALKRFLLELGRTDQPYRAVLEAVFGRSAAELEAEWRAYLPTYFAGRWEVNQVRALDLAEARARFAAGEYDLAQQLFAEARRLYIELEQPARVAEADSYLRRIELARAAEALAAQGRAHLAERAYAPARDLLAEADQHYAEADQQAPRAALAELLVRAEQGAAAAEQLAAAEALLAGWRYPEARARAAEAAALYEAIADEMGRQQAWAMVQVAEEGQRRLALLLLGAGGVFLAAVGIRWARRPTPRPAHPPLETGPLL